MGLTLHLFVLALMLHFYFGPHLHSSFVLILHLHSSFVLVLTLHLFLVLIFLGADILRIFLEEQRELRNPSVLSIIRSQ